MSGPHPAVAAVRTAVRRALADVPAGAVVLVACSGGADSLALAAGLAHEAGRRARTGAGLAAGAVVVDHGLQEGSDALAAAAAGTCRELGLDPVHVVRAHVTGPGGPEAAARDARYAALREVAAGTGAAAVLLGHTLDDQAEGVLLALARGSGERALAGMRPVRGVLRRPLLGLRRTDTEAACAAQGLTPWHDPTNGRDPGATAAAPDLPLRSRVRRDVLPLLEEVLGPGVAASLARTADALAESADALDGLAADLLADALVPDALVPDALLPDGHDAVVLDVAVLAGAPTAVRRRALHAAAVRAGVPAGSLARTHVLAVDALVTDWRGQGDAHLPGGRVGRRSCGRLYLGRPGATAPGAAARARPRDDDQHDGWEWDVDAADMGDDLERVLLSEEQLHTRLDEMAAQIDADYAGREVLLVGVLKGAVMVMADLARRLHVPMAMDWMAVSSYGSGTKSSGVVRILKDLDTDLTGRHVLIVEDIIDSGLTLSWLLSNLRSRGPASVEIATMLRKPDAAKVEVPVRYVGFDIANEFVVGYGLDYAERYRNLPFVGTLAPHVYGD